MAVSIEELHEIVAQIGLSMKESYERQAESDKRQAESDKRQAESDKRRAESDKRREETERALMESRAETERVLMERRAETERVLMESRAETERVLMESRAETERILKEAAEQQKKNAEQHEKTKLALRETAEQQRKTELAMESMLRTVEAVTKNVGGLNNSIGEIVEMIVIPGLKEKMREFQHNFFMASPGKEFTGSDGCSLTEVDLLLENCDEVMVVEVKTHVSIKWVNKHLKRLELLRKNEKITGMTGKVMYAAIAGIGFDSEARDLVIQNGMYLIEIEEEPERVKVIPPPSKAKTW
jgi:hypothetical protein